MESSSSLDESLEQKEPKKNLPRTRDPFAPNKLRRAKDPFMDNVDDDGKKRLRRFDDSYLEFVHMEDRPTKLRRHSDPTPGKPNKLPRTKDPFTDTIDDDGKKRLRRFPDSYLEFVHMEDRAAQLRRISDPLAETEEDKPKRLTRYDPQDLSLESDSSSDTPEGHVDQPPRLTRYDPDDLPALPVNRLVRHNVETMETIRLMDPMMIYGTYKQNGQRYIPRYDDLFPNDLDTFLTEATGNRGKKRLSRTADPFPFPPPPPPPPPPLPGQAPNGFPTFRGVRRMSSHVDPLTTEQPIYMAVGDNDMGSLA